MRERQEKWERGEVRGLKKTEKKRKEQDKDWEGRESGEDGY